MGNCCKSSLHFEEDDGIYHKEHYNGTVNTNETAWKRMEAGNKPINLERYERPEVPNNNKEINGIQNGSTLFHSTPKIPRDNAEREIEIEARQKKSEAEIEIEGRQKKSEAEIEIEARQKKSETEIEIEGRQKKSETETEIEVRQKKAETEVLAAIAEQENNEHASVLAVEGVFFTCELLGDDVILPKQQMKLVVGEFLEKQMKENALKASAQMIHALNSWEKRGVALEIIGEILDNLIANPEYHQIRLSERLTSVRGAVEFLKAIGFMEKKPAAVDGQPEDSYLFMPLDVAKNREHLKKAKDVLFSGVPVTLKLHRNPRVFKAVSDRLLPNPIVPNDFFDVSAENLRLMLCTTVTKESDKILRQFGNKYSLIRIHFPNDYVLQGTFGCYEKFAEVRAFVRSNLAADNWVPFRLQHSVTGLEITQDEESLGDLRLAPSAYVRFHWGSELLTEWTKNGEIPYLRKDLIDNAEPLL